MIRPRPMHALRFVAAMGLPLAACAGPDAEPIPKLEAVVAPATAPRAWGSQPLASLPPSLGRIVAIDVRRSKDGIRQEMRLAGDGSRDTRNRLTVLLGSEQLGAAAIARPPTEAAIRAEIGAAFPHVSMQVIERRSTNAYGAYGLALGRGVGDVRCAYFWQWIEADSVPPAAGVGGAVAIRAALCRSATTFDAMAAGFDHLAIGDAAESPPPKTGHAGRPRRRTHPRTRLVADDAPRPPAVPSPPTMAAHQTAFLSDLPPAAYLEPPRSPSARAR